MKKLAKVLGVLAGIVVVLLVAATVAIKVFLPPAKVKSILESKIAAALHREVKLGDVSVGLFSGLRVTNFALSEAPTFANGTFLSSDALRVRVALLPLLSRKVIVHELGLVKPSVTVVRNADGTFNFSDLSSSTATAAAPAPSGEGAGLSVVVTGARIEAGRVQFTDRTPEGRSVTIDPLDLTVKNFSLGGAADVAATLTAATKELTATLDFAGTANVLKPGVAIKKLVVTSGESKISVAGEARELTQTPTVDLDVTIEKLMPALVTAFATLPESVRWTGPLSGTLKATGAQSDLAFNADLNLTEAAIASPGVFAKPAKTKLTVAASGRLKKMDALSLDNFALGLGTMEITGKGRVNAVMASTRTFALEIDTNKFAVGEALALLPPRTLPPEVRVSGPASLSLAVDGTADAGKLAATIDGANLDLAYADSFRKPAGTGLTIKTSGRYSMPTALDLPALTIALGPMTLGGKATYKSGEKTSSYTASLQSNAFALGPIAMMAPAATSYAPTGTATLAVDVKSTATDPAIKGKFTLKGGTARYEASTLTALDTAATFTDSTVDMPALTGKLNGADLKMSMKAKNVQKHPVVNADIALAELDLEKLLPKTPPAPKEGRAPGWGLVAEAHAAPAPASPPLTMDWSGTFKAAKVKHSFLTANDLNATWDLKDVTPSLSAVTGTAKLRQGKGEFRNIQKLTEESKAARILFLPLTLVQKLEKATRGALKLPSMDRVPYKLVTGDYTFQKGVLNITNFLLDADVFDAGMTGTVGLAGEQPLNCRATLSAAAGVIGGTVGQVFGDSSGKTSVSFAITGTALAPSVSIDKKETGKQVIDAVKGGAADKYLKKLGIPGLGKSKPAPEPASEPAEAPADGGASNAAPDEPVEREKPDTAKDVERLLRGILKKR